MKRRNWLILGAIALGALILSSKKQEEISSGGGGALQGELTPQQFRYLQELPVSPSTIQEFYTYPSEQGYGVGGVPAQLPSSRGAEDFVKMLTTGGYKFRGYEQGTVTSLTTGKTFADVPYIPTFKGVGTAQGKTAQVVTSLFSSTRSRKPTAPFSEQLVSTQSLGRQVTTGGTASAAQRAYAIQQQVLYRITGGRIQLPAITFR